MKITKEITLDNIKEDGAVSLLVQECLVGSNGKKHILSSHREGLDPLQQDRAKEILPDNLYQAVSALWTDELVNAWEKENAEQDSEQEQ